ncbi:MAG: hypothetical protein JO053_09160 [Acidobacteria bacterium]|nr:hypothetical protein [Acidobacteriota bacterium]
MCIFTFRRSSITRVLPILAIVAVSAAAGYGQRTTKVTFNAGIYRDWDHSWMTTGREDVVATLIINGHSYSARATNSRGGMTFGSVACGGTGKITVKFIGTGGYRRTSRNYSKAIPCGKAALSLGRLEFGTW